MNLKTWKVKHNTNLIFRHQSPLELQSLKPLSYAELAVSRGSDIPEKELQKYLSDRTKEEEKYHSLLPEYPKDHSFLYATIVGCHKMESPVSYPGFTYYFSLTKEQIEKCIFHVVADGAGTPPKVGLLALLECVRYWRANKESLNTSSDEWFEEGIDPRIEVVIPFSVKPFAHIPEEEQR